MKPPVYLGVNVDHVATVRQARGTSYPDPVYAALQAEQAGADGITMHLREDRRHIQDRDVERFSECTQTKLNFEAAATDEMLAISLANNPADMCLVPEKREELTTEGGLDVISNQSRLTDFCAALSENSITASLFIDPDEKQIEAAAKCGAPVIELHTGTYADAKTAFERKAELDKLRNACNFAHTLGLLVNAGHGLHMHNVTPIVEIDNINELNIGHSLVANAIFSGLSDAVREMKNLLTQVRYR